ncbi:MAG: hypothetical protein WC511_04615 [Candidatus Pacearchaeota archaeon]
MMFLYFWHGYIRNGIIDFQWSLSLLFVWEIKVNGNWVGEEYSNYFTLIKEAKNQISDGYCPVCLEGFMEIVHREQLKEKIWDEDWE